MWAKNVPNWERLLRVIAGVIGIVLGLGLIGGTLGIVIAVIAAVFVVTGIVAFCPLWALLGRRLE